MFGMINIVDEREALSALEATARPDKYVLEILRWLPPDELEIAMADASVCEGEGMITPRVEDILRRANILREADRIIIKFSRNARLDA